MYVNLSIILFLIVWAQCFYIRLGNIIFVIHFVDEKEMSERTGPLGQDKELPYYS